MTFLRSLEWGLPDGRTEVIVRWRDDSGVERRAKAAHYVASVARGMAIGKAWEAGFTANPPAEG